MKVGYVVLYEDGELVISKKHTVLQKKIEKDYGEFEYINIPWKNDKKKIKQVRILNQIKSNYMRSWFETCYNLTTLIDFQNLDVSDCEDFVFTFYGCKSLTDISSLKNWNVSNGMDFAYMFAYCESLMNISALANWNVVNGKDFSRMFYVCESLQNINGLQNWNVSNCKDFLSMFRNCTSLQDISTLTNWNVVNGEDFEGMFHYCVSLKEIHLPNTLCKLIANMFQDCNERLKIHWKTKIYTYEDLLEYKSF